MNKRSLITHNFYGQLHGRRVRYITDLLGEILELHLGDGVQGEFRRQLVEITIHGLLDPLPMPGPHRRIFQIGDQWKGAPELVHVRSENERKIFPSLFKFLPILNNRYKIIINLVF